MHIRFYQSLFARLMHKGHDDRINPFLASLANVLSQRFCRSCYHEFSMLLSCKTRTGNSLFGCRVFTIGRFFLQSQVNLKVKSLCSRFCNCLSMDYQTRFCEFSLISPIFFTPDNLCIFSLSFRFLLILFVFW